MKLKTLFKDFQNIEIKGSKDIEISSISNDSRYVFVNSLFIAKKGCSDDGSKYINDAVNAGSIAILTDLYDPFLTNITQIIHKNPIELEAELAAKFYNYPSKKLFSVAVTGTCGKTTITYLIQHIFENLNIKSGLIGTIEYIFGKFKKESNLTTPSAIDLQKYLNEMVNSDFKAFCLEASSHGIEQGRVKHIDFDVAIFTNITIDHLDYHKTFEEYKIAKKKLFDNLSEKSTAIINLDDDNSLFMVKDTKAKIFTYSISKKADLEAKNIKTSFDGTTFTIKYLDTEYDVKTSLIGKFNVLNILASIAAGIFKNLDVNDILKAVSSFVTVKGRLEKVNIKKSFSVYVDYSHKPDALKNVLKTLCEIKKNRIICVFGAGGNRDRSKRSLLAMASAEFADISIVTSDNPRDEDPNFIIDEIIKGFSENYEYFIEADREKAIYKAISLAKENDIILIAGKGHETYQIIKNQKIHFDDVKISEKICSIL